MCRKCHKNEKYEIKITEAATYTIDSTDNKFYDRCIVVQEKDYCCYEMEVFNYETWEVNKIIVVCPYYTKIFDNSAILQDHCFYVVLGDTILELDLIDYSYKIHEITKPFGVYYEIYPCNCGFLIYGEIELLLLDYEWKECWRYSTADILYGEDVLHIDEDRIWFADLEGNYHEVDMNGRQCRYEHRGDVS